MTWTASKSDTAASQRKSTKLTALGCAKRTPPPGKERTSALASVSTIDPSAKVSHKIAKTRGRKSPDPTKFFPKKLSLSTEQASAVSQSALGERLRSKAMVNSRGASSSDSQPGQLPRPQVAHRKTGGNSPSPPGIDSRSSCRTSVSCCASPQRFGGFLPAKRARSLSPSTRSGSSLREKRTSSPSFTGRTRYGP